MFAVTLSLESTCAKMLHLNSHYQDMDACVLTNMGLMGLSLKRDFPLFYYLFKLFCHHHQLACHILPVYTPARSKTLQTVSTDDQLTADLTGGHSLFSSTMTNQPLPVWSVVEPAIEQVYFNQPRFQTKDIQKQQPAWAMSEDWDTILVGFAKLSCSRMNTSTLSTNNFSCYLLILELCQSPFGNVDFLSRFILFVGLA